jgi:SAM-dependent methyltransferase
VTSDTSPDSKGWTAPDVVGGFAQAPPNAELMRFARAELARVPDGLVLDIGCGAARNLLPLAQQGWRALGLDVSDPMLDASRTRLRKAGVGGSVWLARASMGALPVGSRSADLVVAHGIWNLARSSAEFQAAVREAARVSAQGAALFVFTFSRSTLPAPTLPVAGESFVFTQFCGEPQCFLTEDELIAQMSDAGFEPDPAVPLREYNRPTRGTLGMRPAAPAIYEAAFRYVP